MITRKEVQHIAKLARLGLTEAEIERFREELSLILDYFELLKEINVDKIEPMTHSVKVENAIREDQSQPQTEERIERILEAAPEKEKNYLKVKAIF